MSISASARMTLWANRIIAAFLAFLIVAMPALLRRYAALRPLDDAATYAIAIGFYCCCVPVGIALRDLERVLRNILAGHVFVRANVRIVRRVRLCCLAVAIICTPAAFFYPPLVFAAVIMGFLTLVISVLCAVLDAAVEIREENDLTI